MVKNEKVKKKIQYRDKHPEKQILYIHIFGKTKKALKEEAQKRDLSMTKLISTILNNAVEHF